MVYVLVTLTLGNDSESLEKYKETAKRIRDKNGAKVINKFTITDRLVGNFSDESVRLLKFPSREDVYNWLSDPEYMEVIPFREKGYKNVTVSILD
jgi:uncharacterized protein (DUF1330 family)